MKDRGVPLISHLFHLFSGTFPPLARPVGPLYHIIYIIRIPNKKQIKCNYREPIKGSGRLIYSAGGVDALAVSPVRIPNGSSNWEQIANG